MPLILATNRIHALHQALLVRSNDSQKVLFLAFSGCRSLTAL